MKLRKVLLPLIVLSGISMSVLADDVWLRAYPGSYSLYTKENVALSAHYKVKMYNPTNHPLTISYVATLCADQNEQNCAEKEFAKSLESKKWYVEEFDMGTAVEYWQKGQYKLNAFIKADGTEHVEHGRYGTITVVDR